MNLPTLGIGLSVLLLVVALGYWLLQAHKTAKRNQWVFDPKPQAPTNRDAETLNKQMIDRGLPPLIRKPN